mgnify:CR=1 FL=1
MYENIMRYLEDYSEIKNTVFIYPAKDLDYLGRLICSFMNSNGGVIVFGVEDTGVSIKIKGSHYDITGVYEKLKNLFPDYCDFIKYGNCSIDGENIDYITVSPSKNKVDLNGIAYYYDDDSHLAVEKKDINIFLSYCWNDSKIADIIDRDLPFKNKRINIVRDTRELVYKDSIEKYMQTIKEQDYVLSLISDAYLKSKNCMYEICELMRDRNYMDRLLFIVLSDDDINKYCNREQGGAHIFNDADSINYNLYWANKAREYKGKIDQIPEGKAKTTLENTYHMFTTINDNLASFINQLKTRLCVNFKQVVDSDYKDILRFLE